jgi:ribosomal protein S21
MAVNVEVKRSGNENSNSVLRRFNKKTRGAGFLKVVRGKRYHSRSVSKLRRKLSALERLKRTEEFKRLEKLGKNKEE